MLAADKLALLAANKLALLAADKLALLAADKLALLAAAAPKGPQQPRRKALNKKAPAIAEARS